MPQTTVAYIGLGSNLGQPKANIKKALGLIASVENITFAKSSSAIMTKPLAGKAQNDYANCVAQIETGLSCQSLLEILKAIEVDMGRAVSDEKWAKRIIDLDILLFGSEIIDSDSLTVPHRQMHLRTFVLAGVVELAPQTIHPILKETVSVLAKRLGGGDFFLSENSPQLISIAGVIGAGKTTLAEALRDEFNCELLKEAYDTNPFLPEVYAGNKSLALDSQLFFLVSRTDQLCRDNLPCGEPIVSDYIIDKERIYASAWLDSQQLKLYNKINTHLCKTTAAPVVVIYLSLEPEKCLQRIHSRNRPYEQGIDLDFLGTLNAQYEKLFSSWNRCPLFRIDSSKYDFRNSDQAKSFAEKIKHYIVGA